MFPPCLLLWFCRFLKKYYLYIYILLPLTMDMRHLLHFDRLDSKVNILYWGPHINCPMFAHWPGPLQHLKKIVTRWIIFLTLLRMYVCTYIGRKSPEKMFKDIWNINSYFLHNSIQYIMKNKYYTWVFQKNFFSYSKNLTNFEAIC